MPISQLLIMPMMFLSGSLFPIAGLPALAGGAHPAQPAHLRVQPMRHFTLGQLSLTRGRAGSGCCR